MPRVVEIEDSVLQTIISESIKKYTQLLSESKRDDLLLPYLELLHKKGDNATLGQLKTFLLKKFTTEFSIHSLSASSNLYLAGVARYYFEGYLTTNKRLNIFYPRFTDKPNMVICEKLDKIIEYLRNSYIDSVGTKFEQPEDFGSLPLDKLLKKYEKKVFGKEEAPQEEVNLDTVNGQVNKNYTYQIIYSYEEARKFEQYTKPGAWCITYGQQHYNHYIRSLKGIHYIVFMRNGFENVPRQMGRGFSRQKPQDEYGNSLICVLQSNSSPRTVYITSRWNHGSSYDGTSGTEADHAYTEEEFLNVIGADSSILDACFQQWQKGVEIRKKQGQLGRSKTNKQKLDILRKFKYAQMMVNGGANPQDFVEGVEAIVGTCENLNKGIYLVSMQDEEGNNWWTMYDRRRFAFDKMLIQAQYRPNVKLSASSVTARILCVHNNKDYYYYYNTRKHEFIEFDGKIQVPYSNRYLNKDLRYTMVAFSGNQIGVLDLDKGIALKAPNGATIFESITIPNGRWGYGGNRNYRGQIELYTINNDSILKMVYDSSANIEFGFDCEMGEFVKQPKELIQDGFSISRKGKLKTPYGNYLVYDKCNMHHSYVKVLDRNNNTFLTINGNSLFSDIDIFRGKILIYKPFDEEVSEYNQNEHYLDLETRQPLYFNGQELIGKRSDAFSHHKWMFIQPISSSGQWYGLLYSPDYNVFYQEPNGEYMVHIYGMGSCSINDGPQIYVGDEPQRRIPQPEQYVQQLNNMRESIKNNFQLMLEKLKKK